MAEKIVMVGVIPEVVAISPSEQVVWFADFGNLKVEFDPNRCPFLSNIFQAPAGMRLHSGNPRPGTKPGSYKYSLLINERIVGYGEVIVRES